MAGIFITFVPIFGSLSPYSYFHICHKAWVFRILPQFANSPLSYW
ncbi:unnamed protein product [Soboliphyme baturini]|uniref:Uncharacterized protein n=1 Tax=Soboliphyme baturini TaxID=241478 RepID=A0A183IIA8_9BILA|nr:unnamed protein product [Soboliphyme baturini]